MFFNLLAETAETAQTAEPQAAQPQKWWEAFLDSPTVQGQIALAVIKVLIALLIMFVAFKIINLITKSIFKRLQKKNADLTISKVSTSAARIILKLLVIVCLIGFVGIETAAISSLIASLGIGVSLAVQGTLSNFAGGVIIIIMRPFKIGDFITSNGESGTVEDIKLFYTHIVTVDNRAVVIPNGALANNVIVNASAKDTRRCDITVSVGYGSNLALVKEVLKKVCADNELIFKDPEPFVELANMGESSLDFTVRAWCNSADYWTVNFYLLDAVKKAFDENGIEIPFNQLDVNVKAEQPQLPEKTSKK